MWLVDPFKPVAAKTPWLFFQYSFDQSFIQKIFQEEMLIKTQPTTPLEIFCEFMLHSCVILECIIDPDDFKSARSKGMHGLPCPGGWQVSKGWCMVVSNVRSIDWASMGRVDPAALSVDISNSDIYAKRVLFVVKP